MGVRGEIFSSRVILPNRTYFFNVKENRMGDIYLNIVESKNRETGGFERQSVILFADDLQDFLKGFDESLRVMEKAVREGKKRPSRKPLSRSILRAVEPSVRAQSRFSESAQREERRNKKGRKVVVKKREKK